MLDGFTIAPSCNCSSVMSPLVIVNYFWIGYVSSASSSVINDSKIKRTPSFTARSKA